MPATFTTDLPDEDQPQLGNGVEDEVHVDRETAPTNHGSVRIQIRETGESAWDSSATGFAEFIGSHDTLTMEFVGREDGEEYEVRARTETEHVTGSWTDPVSIVTKFPGVTELTVASTGQTTVTLEAVDNADNEAGIRVERQREYSTGWGPWRDLADLSPHDGTGTFTYVDDSASPGATYRYRVEPYSEYASAVTGPTGAVETESSDRPRTRTKTSGWTVHVHHPSTDTPIEPQILDDPQFTPSLKDYPRIEIPVPKDEKWLADAFDDARVSVWKDGRIKPIDELVNRRMESDRTVLVARGGSELDDRVTAEFDNVPAHEGASQLIETNTGYLANVDDPASTTQPDTVMQDADTTADLQATLPGPIPAEHPVGVKNGHLQLLQSCFVSEGEAPTTEQDPVYYSDMPDLSGGSGRGVYQDSSNLEYEFTVPYRIPASRVGLKAREIPTDNAAAMRIGIVVDGTYHQVDYLSGGEGLPSSPSWREFGQKRGFNGEGYQGPAIPAGSTVTVRLEGDGDSGGSYGWDLVALYDAGYEYDWPASNDGAGGYLAGPQLYPDAHVVEFAEVPTAFLVTAGRIAVEMDDTSGAQALALSNDAGVTWTDYAANTTSFETEFGDAGSSVTWRVRLGRYGSQSGETPTQGVSGQSIDSFTLYADLEDTPVLDAQSYDGELKDVLNQIANYGNFIWSLERDADGWRVEWTQPGHREADVDEDLVDYQVEKSTEGRYERAVIKGGNQPVRAERFRSVYDTWVDLTHTELVSGSDYIPDPEGDSSFEVNVDYRLDRDEGRIMVLSGGAMADDTVYEIDYEFKPRGSYTARGAGDDPDTIVETRPELASDRACEQAALYLIQRVQEAQWSAEVTVPTLDADVSLVDAFAWTGLPTRGEHLEIQNVEQSPQEAVVQLGNWTTPGDVLDDFATRISANSSRS